MYLCLSFFFFLAPGTTLTHWSWSLARMCRGGRADDTHALAGPFQLLVARCSHLNATQRNPPRMPLPPPTHNTRSSPGQEAPHAPNTLDMRPVAATSGCLSWRLRLSLQAV